MCDGLYELLIIDTFSWAVFQCFDVPYLKGGDGKAKENGKVYHSIPGNVYHYSGFSPLWMLSYRMIIYLWLYFERTGKSFYSLMNMPPGMEIPWLDFTGFGDLIRSSVITIVREINWQPIIDAVWENRCVEDYESGRSPEKETFLRDWYGEKNGKTLSIEQDGYSEDGESEIMQIPDPGDDVEDEVIFKLDFEEFKKSLSEKDRQILELKIEGYTEQEIAEKVGYRTASAVHKKMQNFQLVITERWELNNVSSAGRF